MARNEDRRTAPRIQMKPAVEAALAHMPVTITDVSASGARIHHETPFAVHTGKRFVLELTFGGQRFSLTCTIARSRLEMNPATRRTGYVSGLRFVDVDEFTIARFWMAMAYPSVQVSVREATLERAYAFEILPH